MVSKNSFNPDYFCHTVTFAEPKKNYVFTSAAKIPDLQFAVLQASDFEFEKAIIDSNDTDDCTYVLELVRVDADGDRKHYFLLQSRNTEL